MTVFNVQTLGHIHDLFKAFYCASVEELWAVRVGVALKKVGLVT